MIIPLSPASIPSSMPLRTASGPSSRAAVAKIAASSAPSAGHFKCRPILAARVMRLPGFSTR